ncbi:MAG: TIGR01777 family oxidoreductase [Bacteroidetes bacterium]|jgi:uncharacterized protein (TIGR01777 family)|nr:TIGR01777 family oxidoreductase [Bacteroidota bacterium]
MKYKKIILAGGNGYLGGVLARYYRYIAEEVIILSRKPKAAEDNIKTVLWDGKTKGEWIKELEGADMLINLCGKNVNCRYTAKNREEIIRSRVVPTALLNEVVGELSNPPALWINITSATIYRHAEDFAQDEAAGQIGYGFSIDVCRQWEETFFSECKVSARKVAFRMGIVLGRSDSVFPRLLNLVRFGLGGRQGNGEQYVSWVHEQDVARSTEWILDHPEMIGVINCTAPEAIKNTELMHALRKSYGMPVGLPTPAWLLNVGARIIGTETELILKSRWVAPKRLLDSGYQFLFTKADYAIDDILSLRV